MFLIPVRWAENVIISIFLPTSYKNVEVPVEEESDSSGSNLIINVQFLSETTFSAF